MEEKIAFIDQAMKLAIKEAARGAGAVSPNPQVGCAILSPAGDVIALGYHKYFGGAHAEVNAIAQLSPTQLKGATVVVTLEPCAHEGKTPSCAKALAKLPIKEVIYGVEDPNPLVAGKGAEIIRQAGISCQLYQGVLNLEIEEVAEQFLVNQREKKPFISLKVATSLDGQMGLKTGESKWITGEASREHAHFLRATHEAVLVGQGTLLIDDPALNIRHADFPLKQNKVIVLLSAGDLPESKNFRCLESHELKDVFFLQKTGAGYQRLWPAPQGGWQPGESRENFSKLFQRLDPQPGQELLIAHSILVEGGGKILSSFISDLNFHRLYLFQAPTILGAISGKSWTEQVKIETLADKIQFSTPRVSFFKSDTCWTAKVVSR